ncbi:MAG TPA: hypothetical protein PLB51_00525 [Candidatus Paceibacterota bacterium]|nr:hypothetical protein [Candidatus Paceibacterota bacterium]
MSEKQIKTNVEKDCQIIELLEFFELLARFDYEDKQKSEAKTDSLESAPKESVLGSDIKK